MTNEEREKMASQLFEECLDVMRKKGRDYSYQSGADDSNTNFKTIASLIGEPMDKYYTWFVYFMKHILAIKTFIVTRKLESEGLRGRIIDAINYLVILLSLVEEDKPTEAS